MPPSLSTTRSKWRDPGACPYRLFSPRLLGALCRYLARRGRGHRGPAAVVTEKVCSRCKNTKPLTAFSPHKGKPDGRQSWCRQCAAEYRRELRRANPYTRAYDTKQNLAYYAALRRLRQAHREQFDTLLVEEMHRRGIGERLAAS